MCYHLCILVFQMFTEEIKFVVWGASLSTTFLSFKIKFSIRRVFINRIILRKYRASFITPIVMQNNAHNYEFATYQSIWATNKVLQAQFGQTNISWNRESLRNLQTKGHCSAFELNFLHSVKRLINIFENISESIRHRCRFC